MIREAIMTELRIAILGSGYMGRTYAECITKFNTRAKLVAISGGRRAPGLAADYSVDYELGRVTFLRPDTLFVDKTINESFPGAATAQAASGNGQPVVLSQGRFHSGDRSRTANTERHNSLGEERQVLQRQHCDFEGFALWFSRKP